MIFVVSFNRVNSDLKYKTFDSKNRQDAESYYRQLLTGAMFPNGSNIEVNMFEADSEDVFRKTHSRYFKTQAELMRDIVEQLQSTTPR